MDRTFIESRPSYMLYRVLISATIKKIEFYDLLLQRIGIFYNIEAVATVYIRSDGFFEIRSYSLLKSKRSCHIIPFGILMEEMIWITNL